LRGGVAVPAAAAAAWGTAVVAAEVAAAAEGDEEEAGSPSAWLFSCDWELEDEEWALSLELLRVSVLVLDFFILRRLASGALSTVCSRKPSRLHLLNAWAGGEGGEDAQTKAPCYVKTGVLWLKGLLLYHQV